MASSANATPSSDRRSSAQNGAFVENPQPARFPALPICCYNIGIFNLAARFTEFLAAGNLELRPLH